MDTCLLLFDDISLSLGCYPHRLPLLLGPHEGVVLVLNVIIGPARNMLGNPCPGVPQFCLPPEDDLHFLLAPLPLLQLGDQMIVEAFPALLARATGEGVGDHHPLD